MNMKVGYARTDITPQEAVPLAGYGNTSDRLSEVILDPLYATCIAFENEAGEKALVYTVDLINAGRIQTAPLITHRYPIEQLEEAIHMQMSAESIKVQIIPHSV